MKIVNIEEVILSLLDPESIKRIEEFNLNYFELFSNNVETILSFKSQKDLNLVEKLFKLKGFSVEKNSPSVYLTISYL